MTDSRTVGQFKFLESFVDPVLSYSDNYLLYQLNDIYVKIMCCNLFFKSYFDVCGFCLILNFIVCGSGVVLIVYYVHTNENKKSIETELKKVISRSEI